MVDMIIDGKSKHEDDDQEFDLLEWREDLQFHAHEQTKLLKKINSAVQIIGVIILLGAILAACSALRLF